MAENSTQHSPIGDEIDLREIIDFLIDSKKLIISSILIFTIAGIIYSFSLKPSFKTSTILEIGYFELPNQDVELIESPSTLISDLKLLVIKNPDGKFSQNISMNLINNKGLIFETTSSSIEKNENLLTEITNYILERHSNLSLSNNNQKKNEISNEIDLIKSDIAFIKAKQLESNQIKQAKIEEYITKLKTQLPFIDQEIKLLDKVIIEDTNNLSLLNNTKLSSERALLSPTLEQTIFTYKSKVIKLNSIKTSMILEIENLNNQLESIERNVVKSELIYNLKTKLKILENQLRILMSLNTTKTSTAKVIETETIKPKYIFIIFLGLIFGSFTGIFLVLIRYFIRIFKEA